MCFLLTYTNCLDCSYQLGGNLMKSGAYSVQGEGCSEEGIAPFPETFGAVFLLFGIGLASLSQPVLEQFMVLLQNQELA